MRLIFLFLIQTLFTSLFAEEKFVIGNCPQEGFFSSFCSALNNIMWAEKNGKVPVMHWDATFCHYQKTGWRGRFQPWEYYFEPVSHLAYEPTDSIYRVYGAPDDFNLPMIFVRDQAKFEELRPEAKNAIDKYIGVRPEILEKVDLFYQIRMANAVNIGIHMRGTDRAAKDKWALPNDMIEEAKKLAAEIPGKVQFFIATDEECYLDLAKKSLEGLIYCDSTRSQDGSPLHLSNPQKKRSALLGEEVLIEGLLLTKCDYLLHSMSAVPIAVMMMNPSIKNVYFNPYKYLYRN
jgi:hypothetical protein